MVFLGPSRVIFYLNTECDFILAMNGGAMDWGAGLTNRRLSPAVGSYKLLTGCFLAPLAQKVSFWREKGPPPPPGH